MTDDAPEDRWPEDEPGTEPPAVPHDDIMKRLLDYQHSLREGASPEEASRHAQALSTEIVPEDERTPTNEVVDLSTTEPELEVEGERAAPEVELASGSEGQTELVPEPPEQPPPEHVEAEVEAEEPAAWTPAIEPAPSFEPMPEPFEPMPTPVEHPPAPSGVAGGRAELEARVATLEERLGRLAGKLSDLRQSFQDMAVAADERLAAMQDELGRAREEPPEA